MTDLDYLPADVFSTLTALESLDVDDTPGSQGCSTLLSDNGCTMRNVVPSAAPASSQPFCVCGGGPDPTPTASATATASASMAPSTGIQECVAGGPALICRQNCQPVLRWCYHGNTVDQVRGGILERRAVRPDAGLAEAVGDRRLLRAEIKLKSQRYHEHML